MPLVAAQQLGVGGADRAPVPVHHQLQLVLVQVHHGMGGLLRGREEQDGEDGHLKLGADPDEGTAHRLDQPVPAELGVHHVVVCVRLPAG